MRRRSRGNRRVAKGGRVSQDGTLVGRRRFLLAAIVLAATLGAMRTAQLSLLEHGFWLDRATAQQADPIELPAPRGTIFDRDGVPLAASRDAYQIAVAPEEVTDSDDVIALLREHLGLSLSEARRTVDPDRKWRVLPGRYDEPVRDALENARGVHVYKVNRRFYPHDRLAGELLGTVNAQGAALGGIELEFDSLLTGTPGEAIVRHGPGGQPLPGAALPVREALPGFDVYLTIDYELQEIADAALRDALSTTQAQGGELLMVDPRTGEVLAAVSRGADGTARSWGAVTSPYEAGSVMKPFTVAALLAQSRMSLTDSLHGEDGRYTVAGRTIRDVHEYGWLTLADGLRLSSNIVLAKAADALDEAEQFGYLRDFGFGTPTGVRYPAESPGKLYPIHTWTRQSAASLAIGYEVSVTPLQLALAYAALANGGILMEPRLVREVRTRGGRLVSARAPRALRRVVSREVSDALRDVMVGVVETGTGQAAGLGPFKLAGKTGTAKIVVSGRYEPGAYNATFAGFFPAEDPQLVFVVKLNRPRGEYYGGTTAAPVTRATLEAALAARGTPLDRRVLASRPAALPGLWRTGREPVRAGAITPVGAMQVAARAGELASIAVVGEGPGRLVLGGEARVRWDEPGGQGPASTIPIVRGMPVRDAAATLSAAGYVVTVAGTGGALRTEPAAGAPLERGGIVRLIAGTR